MQFEQEKLSANIDRESSLRYLKSTFEKYLVGVTEGMQDNTPDEETAPEEKADEFNQGQMLGRGKASGRTAGLLDKRCVSLEQVLRGAASMQDSNKVIRKTSDFPYRTGTMDSLRSEVLTKLKLEAPIKTLFRPK